MKFITNLLRGKPASLEEGPMRDRSTNGYQVLHERDESRTNCGRIVQIVKVILYIGLIILIGWLGCVSFSYFSPDQNVDCRVSAIGCKASQIDNIAVKNSLELSSVGDKDDGRNMCERNAKKTRRRLESLAFQFVTAESSDATLEQLRRNFIKLTIFEFLRVITTHSAEERSFEGFTDDTAATTMSLFSTIPNDHWQGFIEELSEIFVNSTDSLNRQRLEARGLPIGAMTSEFRALTESFYIDLRYCNKLLLNSMLSVHELNRIDKGARLKRESKPLSQLTVDCRDAETQLMEERRERLEVLAADLTNGRPVRFGIKQLLTSIESALNTANPSEVTVDDGLLQDDSGLIAWNRFMTDASLQLKSEFYELVRDEFLELRNANDQSSEWEGYDLDKTYKNWTNGLAILTNSESPEAVLNITIKFGKAFNLHYVKAEREDSSVDSEAPAFGTLTYLDAEPEKPSVRRLRHILNGFVRLYFRVINRLGPCQPAASETVTGNRRFVKKRSVTSEPIPKPVSATCWNDEEEERVLLEERRARQEIFARTSGLGYEYERRTQQMFLEGIDKALNATSTSEIRFEDELMDQTMVLPSIQYLVTNASLKLQKEGYELARDLFMEMHGLNFRGPEWEGWEQDRIARNLTDAIFFSKLNMTSQSIFDNFVRFGEAFNLRYEKPENGASGNAPYGKFINIGKEREKLGVRHLRHTLDSFVRLYYKIQNPSTPGVCSSIGQTRAKHSIEKRWVSITPIRKSVSLTCWSTEQDDVLLEERRARLETFTNKEAKDDEHDQFTRNYLEGLAAALNATQTSEINFNQVLVDSTPILRFMNYLLTNSSLELQKEGYEIIRDMYLEMLELRSHSPEWDGYDEHSINENMTALGIPGNVEMNSESIFHGIVKFGIPFNLGYQELVNRTSGDEPDKPVFGKLTYVGDEPEKLGVRQLRHILDGFVKLYFKIQDPSTRMICNTIVQSPAGGGEGEIPTRDERSVEKRSVSADPVPESTTRKCWSEDQDKILEEERLERLAAFAIRTNKKVMDRSYTNAYLEGIEAALNATSISEIHFEDNFHKPLLMTYMESLSENSSLDIRKEGYEINRDLHLELHELENHRPAWKGYNMDRIHENLTASHSLSVNMTKEGGFNSIVTFGKAFNLRYEELGNRESGADPNEPVFGKFRYMGEEPEKLGIRRLRHIFDAFAKFYFKTQDPSSICKGDASTTTLAPEPTNAKCWNVEPALLEERRERLEAYATWNNKKEAKMLFTKNYLDILGEALNASSASEIHFDEKWSRSVTVLSFIQDLAMNSSLELCKEGLEIIRDLTLEVDELEDHTSEWEGYDFETILNNLTDTSKSDGSTPTLEVVFDTLKKFGRALNLRYEENANGDSGDKTDKVVLGKFTYLGDEPEKLGVRQMRHILDGAARFFFKVRHPSTWGVCNSTAPTREKHSIEKRTVTTDPVPSPTTKKCWSEDQDKILEEERLERLAAFAVRTNKKVMDRSYTNAYLEGIEAALNATSISEIHFEDHFHKPLLMTYMESLSENSSLDIRKEGYEINRDLHLELRELENHSPAWKGYNMDRIHENLTASHSLSVNMTKEGGFNSIVTFGKAFNLRYEELGNRESGADPNEPVFGKFTYMGEEPEKLGIHRLRHIFDAFAKFYFKTQDPSSICKGGASNTTPAPEPTNAKCWNVEQDPALLEERRERLEAYATWNNKKEAKMLFTKNYLDILGEALNASSASEIHFDEKWSRSVTVLSFIQDLAMNSSLELCKEGLEIIRDLTLEVDELEDHTSEWEGYDFETILNNLTDTSKSDGSTPTLEVVFDTLKKFGRALNLRYEENANGDSGDKTDKVVLGKFTYLGDEPEKLGIRQMRHILDGAARFFFKVRHPSTWGVCNSTAPTPEKRSIEKRAVTTDPVPQSITTKCWSEEQDKILEEERLERLAAFAIRTNKKVMDRSYTNAYLEGIEAALNATSISEIHFEDNFHKPLLMTYMESLSENSSLDIRKEGYEINRDLHLELHELENHSPAWKGYNMDRIHENLTASHSLSVNMTKEGGFNSIVTFGKAFNLRYEELGNRESGADPNEPVFGKFTYMGEEPEKLGIRRLRHIFDAFAKFYFKTQDPSSICKGDASTTTLAPEPTDAKCWNAEQDPALLEERRERLEAYATWNGEKATKMLFTKNYLEILGEALNASSASEIHFDDKWSGAVPILAFTQDLAMNSTLELCKEILEIALDLWLEIDELEDHTSEWEGYDPKTILNNLTDTSKSDGSTPTLEIMFDDLKKFGRPFHLRYEENANGDSGDKADKVVLGKFTYVGEEPEKLGVRHMRHILDGFARFYFKVRHPSTWNVCNSTVPTREKRSIEKRTVTTDPVPSPITTKCWSEEQDKILEEERRERLAAYAFRTNKKVLDNLYTKTYLESLEAALNATSISEIHFEDNVRKSLLLTYMESLFENSSLDIRKEGYELDRDLHLEFYELVKHSPGWEGYSMERIEENLTASNSFSINMTKEAMFNDIVRFSNAFNLRYEELGNRESGAEPNKPVFGKFTYIGEEPEKLGIRHLRHILDAFAKFYFKTQDPSSICKGDASTSTPAPEPTDAKCWNAEQDPVLLEERRERLKAYALWNEKHEAKMIFSKNYLDILGEALSASNASEIHFNEHLSRSAPILAFIQDLAMNSSLELCKEVLEIARDLWLEVDELEDHTSAWEGYDLNTILYNLTDTGTSDGSTPTLEMMFDDLKKFGRAFNLRYEEIETGYGGDKTDKPVLGKFTYLGEEPEQLGVRHMRHILDGFARFYFKVRHPSTWGVCNSTASTPKKRSIEKRAVTTDPVPQSITTKCWSEEQDKILQEERLERLAAFAFRTNKNVLDNSYTKAYLEGIEAALNATSISEIHFEDNLRKSPLLTYMESLCENSSLDVRKEGYEINRDLHLELYELRNHAPEWDGYNMERIVENLTTSHIFSINMTKEAMFNDIVRFSNAFNLRYEELGNRESGAEPNKPVFGKFTYLGEEPEKLGIRHLRHILDAFAKFYFKTQDPSSICKGDASTSTLAPQPTDAKCWNAEQDPVLLEERRERLKTYALWTEKHEAKMIFSKNYMDILGEALSASNASEIHFDEQLSRSAPILSFIQDLAMNSSLELCKEVLEIARDLWLEVDALEDHTSEWEGYDLNTVLKNLTDTSKSDGSTPTLEMMFDDLKKFGRAFNLLYEEIETGDGGDETHKPVLGKFTYLGEEPEQLGVRHMRHILDGFARFYFKVRHPSIAPVCKSSAEGGLNTNTG